MGKKQPPLLLTSHGVGCEKQSFYDLLENKYVITCIPILCNKRILGSGYGWLVLVEFYGDDCCLWNPASMEVINLPALKDSHLYNRCVLSKSPTEINCHILFNHTCTTQQSFCKIGDRRFLKAFGCMRLTAMTSFQGKIYGIIDHDSKFVTIDFHGEDTIVRIVLTGFLLNGGSTNWRVPQPKRSWVTWYHEYLIETPCGGELILLVIKIFSGSYLDNCVEFRVFRVDVNGMECVVLDNIDGLTIFLSYYGNGFCCSSVQGTKIQPNSIYYANESGRDLYIYRLDNRSTKSLLPCPAADRYLSVNYWVDLHDILHGSTN